MMWPEIPVPGTAVTCGLRTDVGRKLRRHLWYNMGLDTRHLGDGSFGDMRVLCCVRCGADRYLDPETDGPWMRQQQ